MKEKSIKIMLKLLSRIKELILKEGIYYFIHTQFILPLFWSKVYNSNKIWGWLYKLFSKKFKVGGNTYNYFYHEYNDTWLDERAVEVPIIWEIVGWYIGNNILEVGNVLSHYFIFDHDIVDKYEKANGVINQDVVDYHPPKRYDLIISISTLEHVGWDENPRDPMKILQAIENLKYLLTPRGIIIITLPVGLNPYLDKLLQQKKINYYKQFCLQRISESNKWKEVNWSNIQESKFNKPYPCANGLVVIIIKKNNSLKS